MMKKVLGVVLSGILAFTLVQAVAAEDMQNVGIGFDWQVGPQIPFTGGFGMQGFANRFTLSWMLNDGFSVGVFGESSALRGKHEYTDSANVTRTEVYNANLMQSGLEFSGNIPGWESLWISLDLGTAAFTDKGNVGSYTYTHSDGATGGFGDFGTALPQNLGGTSAPMIGIGAKWALISTKSKGLNTSLILGANLNFVPVSETTVFGTSNVGKAPADKIDPISGYNTLDITAGFNIGF